MTGIAIALILICLVLNFGWACLLTWAICFITSLFGVTLIFSWKLVFAIWIISSIFSTTVNIKKGN